jgi:hypothetical protein
MFNIKAYLEFNENLINIYDCFTRLNNRLYYDGL